MLCYAMLCYALRHAMLCYALRHASHCASGPCWDSQTVGPVGSLPIAALATALATAA